MKRLFILTLLFMLTFSLFAYGEETKAGFIDAEEAAGELVPIEGADGCYIKADTSGEAVYIVDKNGNCLTDYVFKCVYNSTDYGDYLRVRFLNTGDLSGFGVMDTGFNIVISPNNYQRISSTTGNCLTGDKCDSKGSLVSERYKLNYTSAGYVFSGLQEDISDNSFHGVSELAKERVTAARAAGFLPDTLKTRYFQWGTTKYDWASLTLEAVLLKADTDLYSYITANDITLDYDKYIDVVSPNVLLAEELGLIYPTEGRYFYPDDDITRQEAAYTLNRMCELFNIKTTPKKTVFDDDSDISDWAREAVYNVSGTRIDSTFILPQIGMNSFMPQDTVYYLERAVMAVWRLYSSGSTDFSSYTSKFNITDIGCGLYAYENTEGKWGVYGDNFTVDAFYELPCPANSYSAFNGTFTLISKYLKYLYNSSSQVTGNDFVVFNGRGEIIKSLTYTMKDIKADKPCGLEFHHVTLTSVSGSNLVFCGYTDSNEKEYAYFIKRLVSEKIAGEGFDNISVYADVGFKAVESSTGRECILNPDGSFKEYYTEEE
ncbi:MAG: S-layer homology domain-containing protein [Clostridiales bacterium]|nr:S-layer homology domain-containing protein [Clostridiales bacterium]